MTSRKKMLVIGALAGLAAACLPALAQDSRPGAIGAEARQGDPYLLDVCPVSGEPLVADEAVVKIHEGREFRFCCGGCAKKLAKDPAGVTAKADALIVKRQSHYYPVKTCVVSGEPLEKPVDVVYMNRLVRLCCKGCKREFTGDPKAAIAKLDKLVMAQQREHYPLETCPVSDEPVGSGAVEVVYGNRYMKFCCKRCVRGFEKSPTAYVAKLDKAWAAKHSEHGHAHGEHGEHGAHGEHDGHGHGKGGEHGGTVGGGG